MCVCVYVYVCCSLDEQTFSRAPLNIVDAVADDDGNKVEGDDAVKKRRIN